MYIHIQHKILLFKKHIYNNKDIVVFFIFQQPFLETLHIVGKLMS